MKLKLEDLRCEKYKHKPKLSEFCLVKDYNVWGYADDEKGSIVGILIDGLGYACVRIDKMYLSI